MSTEVQKVHPGGILGKEAQFVSFYLSGRMFGIDINIIKEVNPNTEITIVPRSASHIRGLVNIRGQIVLVMDIAVIFKEEPRPLTELSQLIILKTRQEIQRIRNYDPGFNPERLGDKPLGFLVDSIGDVITVDRSAIEPAPSHVPQNKAGVVRLGKDLLVIVNTGDLLMSP